MYLLGGSLFVKKYWSDPREDMYKTTKTADQMYSIDTIPTLSQGTTVQNTKNTRYKNNNT